MDRDICQEQREYPPPYSEIPGTADLYSIFTIYCEKLKLHEQIIMGRFFK